MLWLEHKYVGILSPRLDRFTRVNSNTYRFRCPICGDSETNQSKTRGYVYTKKGSLRYHCHNCGISMGVPWFIKQLDPNLYLEYVKEKMSESHEQKDDFQDFVTKMKKPNFVKSTPLKDIKKISQLAVDHPAKNYIDKRKIPPNQHYKLFYAPKFKKWVNSMLPDKLKEEAPEEPRLILPFVDENDNLIGFQGRSFKPDAGALRYITIMLNEDSPRIFGLDKVDTNQTIYVVEGPIDSLFIPNCIATAGGDILSEILLTSLPKERIVVIYDNEPRNPDTVKKIAKCIEAGYKVCIWPNELDIKDINDMVLSGMTTESIKKLIDECTHEGAEAKLFHTIWKKS